MNPVSQLRDYPATKPSPGVTGVRSGFPGSSHAKNRGHRAGAIIRPNCSG